MLRKACVVVWAILLVFSVQAHTAVLDTSPLGASLLPRLLRSDESRAVEYLNRFPKIRLWLPDAHQMGHQGLGAETLYRLHSLGYRGQIEVLSHFRNGPKIPLLIPGSHNRNGEVQDFGWFQLKWFVPHFQNQRELGGPLDHVSLGLSVGDDFPDQPKTLQFNTDHFLVLQPQGWELTSGVWTIRDGHHVYQPFPELNQMAHRDSPDPPVQPSFTLFQQQMMSWLSQSLRQHAYLPVYSEWAHPDVLLHLTQALAGFVKQHPSAAPKKDRKGIIVPVFSEPDDEQKNTLREKLRFWMDEAYPGQFFGAQDMTEVMADPTILARLGRDGGVLVMYVGHVPQPSFKGFLRGSDFPPMIQGKGTSAYLRQEGKPFMLARIRDLTDVFSNFQKHPGYQVWDRINPLNNAPTPHAIEFLLQSRREGSAVRNFFSEAAAEMALGQNDALIQGILRVAAETQKECFWLLGGRGAASPGYGVPARR